MSHVPTLICGCGHEMVRDKNGIPLQGNTNCEGREFPYYKIYADRLICKNCHNSAYIPAKVPFVFQHEENFEEEPAEVIFHFAN